jgi:hypothetical protein
MCIKLQTKKKESCSCESSRRPCHPLVKTPPCPAKPEDDPNPCGLQSTNPLLRPRPDLHLLSCSGMHAAFLPYHLLVSSSSSSSSSS